VLNKIDLARAMKVNPSRLMRDALRVNLRAPFIKVNALSGKGIPQVIQALGLMS
jgi:Ni2+-binding GTPase involved in maturation of urease and hydrogenase